MIIRLAFRVVRGAPAQDDRSDDEDEGDDEPQDEDSDEKTEHDVALLTVANGNIPSKNTTNGIAFSNGVHQRKRKE
jgi:hypothetical protein